MNRVRNDLTYEIKKEKTVSDVKTFQTLEQSGHLSQETSSKFLFKNSHMEGSGVIKDVGGKDKEKIEQQAYLNEHPVGKTLFDTGKSNAEKISFVSQSCQTPTVSSSFVATAGASNMVPPIFPPSGNQSTLSAASNLFSQGTAKNTGSFLGNLSYPSDSFNVSHEKDTNRIPKTVTNIRATEPKSGTSSLSYPIHSQEGAALPNSTIQSYSAKANQRAYSLPGHLSAENKSSKQFCNVQHMTDELDKLLECIEEPGGCRDVCTTALEASFEALEKGLNLVSDRNRLWQNTTEKRLREIELLLDNTVQVVAREAHVEGIIRQTNDRHYWELWNCQELSSELDLKRQNLLNLSQELVNQMIGLEKHFNALELNLYGESGVNMASPTLQCKRAPPRYVQSLHAIHNTMTSQLSVAHQLSDFLARQMDALNIRSLPSKQESIKMQLFESIGISLPSDSICSPDTRKVVDSSNKNTLISCSDAAQSRSRRNRLSGLGSHEPETARRRRDSLDKNWSKFDAPKTTVRRILVENQRQNINGSFSSQEKQLGNLYKLERSAAAESQIHRLQDRIGTIPEASKAEAEGSPRLQVIEGSNFSTNQNISVLSSLLQPSPLSSSSSFSVVQSIMGNIQPTAERSSAHGGQFEMKSALKTDLKPSASQSGYDQSGFQLMQPQLLSSSLEESSGTGTSIRSLVDSAPTSVSAPISTASTSASLSPIPSVFPSSPITSRDDGSLTTKIFVNDGSSQVSRPVSSSFSASSSLAHVNSSKGTMAITVNSIEEPPSKGPQTCAVEFDTKTSPSFSGQQPAQNSLPSSNDLKKFESNTTTSPLTEIQKEAASETPHDLSRMLASEVATSNTQPEKTTVAETKLPPVPSFSGVNSTGGNDDAAVSQEDEMEEEAPETADISLGSSLGAFGLGGSVPNTNSGPISNSFGGSITGGASINTSSSFMSVPSGELFHPASLSFQSLQTAQQPAPAFSSASFGRQQPSPASSGFGQPSQIGFGQQDLGSVFGSFGQSRQIGGALPGNNVFGGIQSAGGCFQNAANSGGFAAAAATGGGFAGMGNTTGGGFASAAGGGFASLATSVGGFAKAANSDGGFGAFNKQ